MKMKFKFFLVGISFAFFFLILLVKPTQAITYENEVSVSFYQNEDLIPSQDKDKRHSTLPKTGESYSYMSMLGAGVIFFLILLKKKKRPQDNN